MNNKASAYFVQSAAGKPSAWVLSCLMIFSFLCVPLNAQEPEDLKVMTFNIRYGTANDGENSWQFRKDKVVQTIRDFKPDILGLQEALQIQIDELLAQMPEYSYSGVGRDDGKSAGEHSCIFYLKERFDIDSTGTFWFSDTPEVAGSKSWGNNITRICSWVLLNDKMSGMKFYHFNLHFDHESQASREKSAELVLRRINQKILPLILTGDFNCGEENAAMQNILAGGLTDTYRAVNKKLSDEGTFNSFKGETTGDRIDFILVTKDFLVRESQIVRTSFEGKFPSDHFPVTSVIGYTK
ncbi:MAG: endonuclease/exonuclease/phosphatase family protein [Melioribacteraceae bacterium]